MHASSEEVLVDEWQACDWKHIGEGAANVVFAYVGNNPALVLHFLPPPPAPLSHGPLSEALRKSGHNSSRPSIQVEHIAESRHEQRTRQAGKVLRLRKLRSLAEGASPLVALEERLWSANPALGSFGAALSCDAVIVRSVAETSSLADKQRIVPAVGRCRLLLLVSTNQRYYLGQCGAAGQSRAEIPVSIERSC